MKRHTCIICGRKRYERSMKKVFLHSWACSDKHSFNRYCYEDEDIKLAIKILDDISKIKNPVIKNIIKSKTISPQNVTPERTISQGKK